ncbi:hypothetical protein ACTQ50_19675 [Blautia sp. Sow4_E7]|uniref:hypothetical protein n=1 Tax=Blautia sp. Sow4_E7 TaxID=3438749 RepID=UPI003F9333D0
MCVTEEKFQVEFFETDKGTKPAKEFLDSLDTKMRAKVLRLLVLAEKYRNIFLAREAEKDGKHE